MKEINIGDYGISGGVLSKSELITNIKNKTPIGEIYVKMQLRFIKWSTKRLLGEEK